MQVNARQIQLRTYFEDRGLHRSGASALVGNFCQEVGPNLPTAFRKSGLDHGSQGLAQWRLERLAAYMRSVQALHPEAQGESLWAWYGRMSLQADFVVHELKTVYPQLYTKLVVGGDPAALAADVCWQYERPSKVMSGIANRVAWAKAIAAAPSPKDPKAPPAPANVVTHLQHEVDSHETSANGAVMTGGASALVVAAVPFVHFLHDLEPWQIAAMVVGAVIAVFSFVASLTFRKQATNVASALPRVDAHAPPAPPEPPIPPVIVPPPQTPAAPPAIDPEVLAKAVAAEIARRDAIRNGTKADTAVDTTANTAVDTTAGRRVTVEQFLSPSTGATMTIGGRK